MLEIQKFQLKITISMSHCLHNLIFINNAISQFHETIRLLFTFIIEHPNVYAYPLSTIQLIKLKEAIYSSVFPWPSNASTQYLFEKHFFCRPWGTSWESTHIFVSGHFLFIRPSGIMDRTRAWKEIIPKWSNFHPTTRIFTFTM